MRHKRALTLSIGLVLLSTQVRASTPAQNRPAPLPAGFDTYVTDVMRAFEVPGLALALKDADDQVRYIAADSFLRFGPKARAAMFSDSSIEPKVVASMSKNRPVESNSRKEAPTGTRRMSAAESPLIVR